MGHFLIDRWNESGDTAEQLAVVLHDCVHAGASVSFIVPFTIEDALSFWLQKVLPAVKAGDRIVLVARQNGVIVGTVQLLLDMPPNQAHRAEVAKLLVHPGARRCGIARALMIAIEEVASGLGRRLLTLDTVSDSPAQDLYVSLGWEICGQIPGYALAANGMKLEATTVLFRELL